MLRDGGRPSRNAPGMVRTGATFADAAADWLRYIEIDRGRKPSTISGHKLTVRVHLLPAFGELPVESITAPMIETWLRSMSGTARSRRRALVLRATSIEQGCEIEAASSAHVRLGRFREPSAAYWSA